MGSPFEAATEGRHTKSTVRNRARTGRSRSSSAPRTRAKFTPYIVLSLTHAGARPFEWASNDGAASPCVAKTQGGP